MNERAAIDLGGRSLVVGLGATGLTVARFLCGRGHEVRVVDSRPVPPMFADLGRLNLHLEVRTGALEADMLDDVERVIVSPGLALDLPIFEEARRRGLALMSDIEIFAHVTDRPILAVTGSNGKSTVTTLTANLLEAAGISAPCGGNLGPPALELLEVEDADAFVLEVSSFQMETTQSLRARAAVVLNVSVDHLDRHGSLQRYAALKEKLLVGAEHAIVNIDDSIVRDMGSRLPGAIECSIETPLERGYSIVEVAGVPWLARDGQALIASDSLAMQGRHNRLNALAALALADQLVAQSPRSGSAVLEAVREFRGLPHRCEHVSERRGVVYVNDSKATNTAATIAALSGFEGPIVLIAGGIGKGADFAELAAAAAGRVRTALLIGRAAGEIAQAFEGVCRTERHSTLDSAVARAADIADAGDTVLLSPACSSLDMFDDYRARGAAFAAAVWSLPA